MPLKQRIRRFINWVLFAVPSPLSPAMEPVYQGLVERDLARLKIDSRFYPVNGAANYSLLYIIIRAASEFQIEEVLELGAGQTSLLFDALQRSGVIKANIRTLEHNDDWAAHVSASVSHEVVRTKLVPKDRDHIKFEGYDFMPLPKRQTDFLVIDGPLAIAKTDRFSRLGAIDLVEWINPSRFIVVIDDANRVGEILLAKKFEERLKQMGIKYARGNVMSNKEQVIFAGGTYLSAAYY
jgi:hypothetical protein